MGRELNRDLISQQRDFTLNLFMISMPWQSLHIAIGMNEPRDNIEVFFSSTESSDKRNSTCGDKRNQEMAISKCRFKVSKESHEPSPNSSASFTVRRIPP